MNITVNGVLVQADEGINVVIDCGGKREEMPRIHLQVNNGELDAYRSYLTTSGTVHTHLFGDKPDLDMSKS